MSINPQARKAMEEYASRVKEKAYKRWASFNHRGNAELMPIVYGTGKGVAARFVMEGQRAWIAEFGSGLRALKKKDNPFLADYIKSKNFNPVRRALGKWTMEVVRRLDDRPYYDLDGNKIEKGSLDADKVNFDANGNPRRPRAKAKYQMPERLRWGRLPAGNGQGVIRRDMDMKKTGASGTWLKEEAFDIMADCITASCGFIK